MSAFMTGFPGFLASALLPRVLARTGGDAVCLVQPKYAAAARRRIEELVAADPSLAGRIRPVEGDITRRGLGLPPGEVDGVVSATTEAWHLAAVYDLAVAAEPAQRVNVDGTRHVLDVVARCERLDRLHYFSTCYVSGRHPGAFGEDDLEVGAPFNNHYEETKHRAEADVRRRMADGLPATIYRPAIVVGDSTTGATQKFDGPYFILQWLLRARRTALLPVIGDPTLTTINVVPRDFVVAATAHLAGLAGSAGRTYQLADPRPLTIDAMIDVLAGAAGRRVVRVPATRRLAKGLLRRLPGAEGFFRLPAEAIDYFAHPTSYLTIQAAADLAGTGIAVPPFPSYVDRLVTFMRAHPEVGSAAMA